MYCLEKQGKTMNKKLINTIKLSLRNYKLFLFLSRIFAIIAISISFIYIDKILFSEDGTFLTYFSILSIMISILFSEYSDLFKKEDQKLLFS